MNNRILAKLLAVLLALNIALSGCTAAVVVGASAAAAGVYQVATDRRSIGTMMDDTSLRSAASKLVNDKERYADPVKISVTAFNGNILLTGEAGTERDVNTAIEAARSVKGVKHVINEIRLTSDPLNKNNILKDTWITSQIKVRLIATKEVSSNHVKVVTEDNVVYLMGIVSHNEAENAADIASKIKGVDKVVKLFEYQDA